jgi:hypothetical protein
VVILLRRLSGLIVAVLLLGLAVSATAMADGRTVIADYNDNGVIDACYSDADFQEALELANAEMELYGAAVDLIEQKQLECGPTATPGPAPDVDDAGEGGGSTLAIIIGVAVIAGLAAFAYVAWVRRRPGSGED